MRRVSKWLTEAKGKEKKNRSEKSTLAGNIHYQCGTTCPGEGAWPAVDAAGMFRRPFAAVAAAAAAGDGTLAVTSAGQRHR